MSPDKQTLDELRIDRTPGRRSTSPIVWLLVLVLLGGAAAVVVWWMKRPKAPEVRTLVVQQPGLGNDRTALNGSGYVTARREATVSSKVTGKVVANSPYETKAEPEGAFVQGFAEQIGDVGKILIAILSAVFFTILLVAGNTMAQAVRERTQELGVLKAVGFTNELVLALVLVESCLIAAVGGLAGLGLAWLITLGGSPVPSMLPVFYLPYRYIVIGALLVLALGIVAGILPAFRAMRLQIAAALRRNA